MINRIGQQLGNYQLLRLLGQGGFAEVYLGQHRYLKTQAAIKVLSGTMTSQDIQNFTIEAQTIARLNHPHILRVLDFGVQGNIPFLVIEYAPQGTLRDRHHRGVPLSLPTVLSYVKQIASALEYAHTQQLVHRDVKPANMLVNSNNHVTLSDFGIAISAHKTASLSTQEAIGTITYMAPEQIKGKARPTSDQYSLAVVAYEWLCGLPPFDGSTSIEIAMAHLTDPPPLLRTINTAVPSTIEQVILKALAKDPGQRYPDMLTFAQALERAAQPYSSTTVLSPQVKQAPSTQPVASPTLKKTAGSAKLSDKDKARLTSYDQGIENDEFDLEYRQKLHGQKLSFLNQRGEYAEIISAYNQGIDKYDFDLEYRQQLYEQKLSFLKQNGKHVEVLSAYDAGIENDEFDLEYQQKLHSQKLSFLKQNGKHIEVLAAYDAGIDKYDFDLEYRQQLYEQKLSFLKQSGTYAEVLSAYDAGIENDEFDLEYRQKLHDQKLSFLEE